MADIYDQTVADMKIGVAFPTVNGSFKYWSDPGTWANLRGWTKYNLTLGRSFTGYDDSAAASLTGSSVPNDDTWYMESTGQQFWPDNRDFFGSVIAYYNIAMYCSVLTGAGTPHMKATLVLDSTSAFPSETWATFKSITSTDTVFTRYTGTISTGSATSDKWCKMRLGLRDATAILGYVDSIGVMFNPFTTSAGYTALTNVRAVSGPPHRFLRFNQRFTSPLGNDREYDASGGAEKLQLDVTIENESLTIYEALKGYYDLNKGMPGLPGVPLMIEPNLPGYPPTITCNIANDEFPIHRQGNTADNYGGTISFRAVE